MIQVRTLQAVAPLQAKAQVAGIKGVLLPTGLPIGPIGQIMAATMVSTCSSTGILFFFEPFPCISPHRMMSQCYLLSWEERLQKPKIRTETKKREL